MSANGQLFGDPVSDPGGFFDGTDDGASQPAFDLGEDELPRVMWPSEAALLAPLPERTPVATFDTEAESLKRKRDDDAMEVSTPRVPPQAPPTPATSLATDFAHMQATLTAEMHRRHQASMMAAQNAARMAAARPRTMGRTAKAEPNVAPPPPPAQRSTSVLPWEVVDLTDDDGGPSVVEPPAGPAPAATSKAEPSEAVVYDVDAPEEFLLFEVLSRIVGTYFVHFISVVLSDFFVLLSHFC